MCVFSHVLHMDAFHWQSGDILAGPLNIKGFQLGLGYTFYTRVSSASCACTRRPSLSTPGHAAPLMFSFLISPIRVSEETVCMSVSPTSSCASCQINKYHQLRKQICQLAPKLAAANGLLGGKYG